MDRKGSQLFRFIDARELKAKPVLDLQACRLAVRAYWWNVAQGQEVPLVDLYHGILRVLRTDLPED